MRVEWLYVVQHVNTISFCGPSKLIILCGLVSYGREEHKSTGSGLMCNKFNSFEGQIC